MSRGVSLWRTGGPVTKHDAASAVSHLPHSEDSINISADRTEEVEPLRILLYTAAPKADAGGVQNVVLGLAALLRKHGHEVVTAWPDGDGTEEDWRIALTADTGGTGWPDVRTAIGAGGQLAGLFGRLARWQPDIVNLHFPRGQSVYFALLARLLRFRLVLSFHNSDVREASPSLAAALPRLIAAADGITAVSSDLAEAVQRYAPRREVRVVPNGVDTAFWSGTEGSGDPNLIAAAGRMTGMKGFDILLQALAKAKLEEARLVVAGEGADRSSLEAQAAALGLADRVTFPGHLGRGGLRDLYSQAGLFALPSRREGMPLALIEAMAAGLPAVASRVNGVPDVMTPDCGEMVPPEDVDTLASALTAWVGQPQRLAAAGQAAKLRASSFSDETSYGAYEALFGELCR